MSNILSQQNRLTMETTAETTTAKKDVHAIATEHVIEHLKRGIVPWLTQWTHQGIPQNLVNHIEFRFINVFLLATLGYKKNFFITQKQLEKLGASVKKKQRGYPAFYWKWPEKSEKMNGITVTESDSSKSPFLRYYYVYNIEQCNEIKKSMIPKIHVPENPLQMCAAIVANMPNAPTVQHGIHPASYMPTIDCIDMPDKEQFPNDESYYCVLFRTLIHSTGHESRLNRKEVMQATLTDKDLHRTEDLISELGASYLSSFAGIRYGGAIDVNEYATVWLEKFQKDSRLIVYASTQAQRAVDYILNRQRRSISDDSTAASL